MEALGVRFRVTDTDRLAQLRSLLCFLQHVSMACLALLALTSCDYRMSQSAETRTQTSKGVLFIGNSHTDVNGGIYKQLEGLAPSSRTSHVAVGGYTLENHWSGGNAIQAIRKGGWGYVVLQEQSQTPISDFDKFSRSAAAFDVEIRNSGAQTVLLMTRERPDSIGFGVTTTNLATAYNTVGEQLGVKVAPAGLAYARSLAERPDLKLYSEDGHPTIYGTYLAACVAYATIFGQSSVGNRYSDSSINPETRAYLQRIAAETVGF